MGTPIIFDKPFKTYDEQLAHLRDDYGLEIGDSELAKYILSTFSYYDIINGYQECMMENGKFKPGISILYLYFFFRFDKEFQNILLKNILIIESSFKSKLSYSLSQHYCVSIYDYLDKTNFKPEYKGKITFSVLRKKMLREIGRTDKKDNLISCSQQPCKHYFEVHHHIPAWILMKNISFDKAITLYLLLKQDIKEEVTNNLIGGELHSKDKIAFVTSALTLIRKFRNVIAHNLKFVTYTQSNSKLPFRTTINLINNSNATLDVKDFDDIYGCIVAIYILLADPKEQVVFIKDLQYHLTNCPLGAEEFRPLTKHIVNDYLEITHLGNAFVPRLVGLVQACIINSCIASDKKEEYLSMCNDIVK